MLRFFPYILLGLTICLANADSYPPLKTVSYVDINRYLGKWYEIARFDHPFQKGCSETTAEYTLRKDGDINIINKCKKNGEAKKTSEAKGRAWIVDKVSNAKLKVQFFLTYFKIPFLSGNYWILELDDDYQYVLIGEPKRKYLWILARNPKIPEQDLNKLIQKARDLKFNTDKLIFTDHN